MKLMDHDKSGSVNFKEFSAIMAEQFYRQPTKKELEAAFDYFDQGMFKNILLISNLNQV
jgi:Ca2+-binding EF-hand superfamily protein